MEHSPSWEANRFSAIQEIPRILWNPKVHTASTSSCHLSLSSASSIQSIPTHPTSWRSILILSSHLPLGHPNELLPSGSPTKTLYTLFFSIRATCHAHLILLDFITRTILGEHYRSLSSSLCSFLQSPVTSSLLGPNILLNTPFSNNLSLRSSLNVSDQVSHPHKTKDNFIVLCILIFKFLNSKLEDKRITWHREREGEREREREREREIFYTWHGLLRYFLSCFVPIEMYAN